MRKEVQKIFFDFEIIAFELVSLDTRFYWERILVIGCQYVNKQSQDFRYYWIKFFRADFLLQWSKNMTKILPCRLMQCFGPFNMLSDHKCSDTRLFRHLNNPAFCSLWFQKEITSEAHLSFESIQNSMQLLEMEEKINIIFFDLELIAFELVALNTRFYWERILVIGCQYVNKQSRGFRYY